MIADNPPQGGYAGPGYFEVESGPGDEEMQSIQALFRQAAISTDPSQALH